MKILYGVQCTGNGHLSRSREIVSRLKEAGDEVHVIFSGRDPDQIPETEIFRPFTAFRGLTYVTERGRVRYLATALSLNVPQFLRDCASFTATGYDLVVTDFEPITSRIARRHGIPSVAIGHQYAFHHDVPMVRGNSIGRGVLRHFAPADTVVGLHWHHFGAAILPPVVPTNLFPQLDGTNRALVYLPFEDASEVQRTLGEIDEWEFVIYGLSSDERRDGNLHWRAFSRSGFLADLASCQGVICNAGFELPSEAIQLGKRLLVKPLHGQMEQESNALALEVLRLGRAVHRLDGREIRAWLNDAVEESLNATPYPDVASRIAEWISAGRWGDLAPLVRATWGERAPAVMAAAA